MARTLAANLVLLFAVACATAELDRDSVDQARQELSKASEMARIYDYGAGAMRQAERFQHLAESTIQDPDEADLADHYAFLARKHVAIAEARLRRGIAEEEIERAHQRLRALKVAAEQRAAAAEHAEAVEEELSDTRMKLRMSERRARALAERLVELGVTDSLD
jgi:hypothetical protein